MELINDYITLVTAFISSIGVNYAAELLEKNMENNEYYFQLSSCLSHEELNKFDEAVACQGNANYGIYAKASGIVWGRAKAPFST